MVYIIDYNEKLMHDLLVKQIGKRFVVVQQVSADGSLLVKK